MKGLNKTLRILALITLVLVFIILTVAPKTNCDACDFSLGGKKLGISKFLDIYFEDCTDNSHNYDFMNYSDLNISNYPQ